MLVSKVRGISYVLNYFENFGKNTRNVLNFRITHREKIIFISIDISQKQSVHQKLKASLLHKHALRYFTGL